MESTPEGGEKKKGVGDGGSGGGGEVKPKRKMKSAAQLEVLEKTYLMETYPSEALRAELSVKLGLTDRQLQMWFCHRRLKDRKVAPTLAQTPTSAPTKRQKKDAVGMGGIGYDEDACGGMGGEMMGKDGGGGGGSGYASGSGSGSGSSPFEPRKVVDRATAAVSRIGADMPMVNRYYEPPPHVKLEARAIAFVEAQLGEPIREDGPILGMEFDPLPPGAFGAPIVTMGQPLQSGRPSEGKLYERRDSKPIKSSPLLPTMEHPYTPSSSGGKRKTTPGGVHAHPQTAVRAPHEYQFIPELPTVKPEAYGRVDPSHHYDTPSGRVSSSSSMVPYQYGKEHVTPGYGFQGQVQSGSVLPPQGRTPHGFPASGEYASPLRSPFTNIAADPQVGIHPPVGAENPFLPSDRQVVQEDDATRIERKRKNDEARMAREAEVHEKRMKKELEKQDILRRKREEQMRREMERHDRERRKEEERLMRERQREEERFQREQRRELERRERFLQKETIRVEKMRQKEELRKEKEAARLKAANERATARRLAKESMELIEDERLELMELAVAKKGLPSILSLDSETLQNLDSFRDMLSTFPPKSMQLKKPFTSQPWRDSEENIGNLLMVWRFLITFTDVLELWPFTLDEFVQSMHDYEPRLLCEIHIALLRSIIKDIEDVARTPSTGLGGNQNTGANPGGGHPQIVEGAYTWGFDIRCWQRHLNPMTWPEILRQFALSAGFGPQLKKRTVKRTVVRDDNEGRDSEDIISTLRNGAAAENALAVMQEKGLSQPRKSRNRLTPGTVKFAAYHILSLEGSKGLSILEVANKIQKSGLRDLTTSKTPEASIAAALSRDGNLFERTAPSTYRVKAAFRKDPADAEAILTAAREKIQIFDNGYYDSDADKEADDVERDLDSECDVTEDPDYDDVGVAAEGVSHSDEAKFPQSLGCSGNGQKGTVFGESPQNGAVNDGKGFSSSLPESSKKINDAAATTGQANDDAVNCNVSSNPEQEDTEIDESNPGEAWVQGLMEGEYYDLTVEERLMALVALVGVAIEGNSIRVVLEERLEAANALKKQMWAEAQLDKRRMKEEYTSKFQYPAYTGIKADPNPTSSAVDETENPYVLDNKNKDESLALVVKQESVDLQNAQNKLNNLPTERVAVGQDFSAGIVAEKYRAQLKAYIGHKAEEMYVYRSLPLGQDRRHNRYWQFVTSASRNDPGAARIFFESQDGYWRLIDSEECFDALMSSLDTRGIRESHLHSMLQKVEIPFKEAVRRYNKRPDSVGSDRVAIKSGTNSSPDYNAGKESPSSTLCTVGGDPQDESSSFKIEFGRTLYEKQNALRRYQDFQKWMWKECFNPSILCALKLGKKRCVELLVTCDSCQDLYFFEDNHCPVCHTTFDAFYYSSDFSEHVNQCERQKNVEPGSIYSCLSSSQPLRVRLLKSHTALIEVSVPEEALQPLWTEEYRKSWGRELQRASSVEELIQLVTLLEGAVKRDYLSANFETTKELLASSTTQGSAADNSYLAVSVLPWVPHTTAAVTLRLMELDASVSYMLQPKVEPQKDMEASEFTQKQPSRYTVVKNVQEVEQLPDQSEYLQEEIWTNQGSAPNNSVRGRGRGASRGGRRLPKGGSGLRDKHGKPGGLRGKTQTRGRGGRRGNPTVTIRQSAAAKTMADNRANYSLYGVNIAPKQHVPVEAPRSHTGMAWERDHTGMHAEEDDNSSSSESSEYEDNDQTARGGYDDRGPTYGGMYHPKSEDYIYSDDEGDNDNGVDSDDYQVGDDEVEDDEDMELDETQLGSEYGDEDNVEANNDEDEAMSSASSDYSV